MSDKSVMSIRQAAELDHALARNGYTPADIKNLSSGDTLGKILALLRGKAEVLVRKHIIDCNAHPFVPDGWTVKEHKKSGQLEWDPTKVELYLDEGQQNGNRIKGNELRKMLKSKPVLNANVLDYLLAHPNLIPEEWKGRTVFFWGTIYRDSDGYQYVRYLYWDHDWWSWSDYWLDRGWNGLDPAAVSASPADAS